MKCYSTVHLTTRLLRHEPGRREAAAYHFGLPADKPLMSQLIVKRLSRHKHFRDMISRRDCSVWNSRSIRPLAWGMLVVLDLPNHGWREASIWIISPQYWHLGRRGCGSSAKSSFSAGCARTVSSHKVMPSFLMMSASLSQDSILYLSCWELFIWDILRHYHMRNIRPRAVDVKKDLLNVMNKQRVLSKKLVSRGVECYNWRNVLYL